MDMEYLEIHSEIFDDIVEDIKQRNLSRNNMPKIIVGTGLSVIYGVPGMKELAEHLAKEIAQSSDEHLKEIWKKHCDEIEANGLEAGLANLAQNENELVDAIKPITAKFILESEEKLHNVPNGKCPPNCECKSLLLSFICAFYINSQLYLITPLCSGGDLHALLLDKSIEISIKNRIFILLQVAKAIRHLHNYTPPYIHHDIKSLC